MSPNEYQTLSQRTRCDQKLPLSRLEDLTAILREQTMQPRQSSIPDDAGAIFLHGAVGLAGEAGEIAACIERYAYYGKDFDRINAIEELGDCLWYIAEMCDAMGVSMESVMELNIRKLQDKFKGRYKSGEFVAKDAEEQNRNRTAEREIIQQGQQQQQEELIEHGQPDNSRSVLQRFDSWKSNADEDDEDGINTEAINDR